MNRIHVLDCTLRDGGYCNQWKFGAENIEKMIHSLVKANIDVIECGYISQKAKLDVNSTQFAAFDEVEKYLPENRDKQIFVAMINYGEYDIGQIPEWHESGLDGIRVAFHKKDADGAVEFCRQLSDKGYRVFVQPMVSVSYTDEEFIRLINSVNHIQPYAFYIVDSFGMMKKKDLIRFFYMVEHNLDRNIWIGFHSHNNLQLAYSNAQSLVDLQTARNILIDSSVYGMGRGSGNLNTELFVEYLNEYFDGNYLIRPLLTIIDEILNDFYKKNYWGYSLSKYLSASHNIHPNYAIFFEEKNTLTVEAMDHIFSEFDTDMKYEFDKSYAEERYLRYMASKQKQVLHKDLLKNIIRGKKVLLIAPGKNAEKEENRIRDLLSQDNVISISINFEYEKADFVFVSNLIRFRDLDKKNYGKCIVTSNIQADHVYIQVQYDDLLAPMASVCDNAGLMAVKLMSDMEAEEIVLAGFDGYSHYSEDNYVTRQRVMITKPKLADEMNEAIAKVLKQYGKNIKISFLTESIYSY